MIQPTGHKMLLFHSNLLPCMDLVIYRSVQLKVKLSILIRKRYFAYSDAIPILFGKMGKCTGVLMYLEELVELSTLPPSLVPL